MRSARARHSERGSALIWAIVAAAVMIGVASMLPGMFLQVKKSNREALLRMSAILAKENAMATLGNEAAWAATILHASNSGKLDCLRTPGARCPSAGASDISVVEADGNVLISAEPTRGFDLQGAPCNEFDAVNGHETCVFRLQISWSCDDVGGGLCAPTETPPDFIAPARPVVRFRGAFQYSPKDRSLLRLINSTTVAYRMDFERGSDTSALAKRCKSFGGVFNSVTLECRSSNAEPDQFDCKDASTPLGADYMWFIGYRRDSSGAIRPLCTRDRKVDVGCRPGTGVTGWNPRGVFGCEPF